MGTENQSNGSRYPQGAPQDRLGITIEISVGWRSLIRSQSPAALFSSLKPFEKENLAREFGSEGSHQYWLEQIVEGLFLERGHRSRISISYAGEPEGDYLTLAELIAQGGRMSGKVVMQDANFLNCEPGNLVSRSSRGRAMACKSCRNPTTKEHSEITKDAVGSSFVFATHAFGACRSPRCKASLFRGLA